MRLVTYLVGGRGVGFERAGMMVESARRVMDCWVVQHTDCETEGLDCVDEVVRLDRAEPMLAHRYRMLAGECGEFLSVDTDELFLEDVSGVFGEEFDVAMARRDWAVHAVKVPKQLYNGVVFCREAGFWRDAYGDVIKKTGKHWNHEWKMADRSLTAAARNWRTLDLDARVFNYEPVGFDDDVMGRKVLHFKSWRKELMGRYYETYVRDCGAAGDRSGGADEGVAGGSGG